jgi:hypothetical protein
MSIGLVGKENSMKRCPKCGRMLDLGRFSVDRSKRTGRKSSCRDCDKARCKAYYAANREDVLARVNAYNARRRAA